MSRASDKPKQNYSPRTSRTQSRETDTVHTYREIGQNFQPEENCGDKEMLLKICTLYSLKTCTLQQCNSVERSWDRKRTPQRSDVFGGPKGRVGMGVNCYTRGDFQYCLATLFDCKEILTFDLVNLKG